MLCPLILPTFSISRRSGWILHHSSKNVTRKEIKADMVRTLKSVKSDMGWWFIQHMLCHISSAHVGTQSKLWVRVLRSGVAAVPVIVVLCRDSMMISNSASFGGKAMLHTVCTVYKVYRNPMICIDVNDMICNIALVLSKTQLTLFIR